MAVTRSAQHMLPLAPPAPPRSSPLLLPAPQLHFWRRHLHKFDDMDEAAARANAKALKERVIEVRAARAKELGLEPPAAAAAAGADPKVGGCMRAPGAHVHGQVHGKR